MKELASAFTFPFKDPGWVAKFVIAAVFMILSIFVIGIFVLAGYFVQVTQRVMRREQPALPEWSDIGVKFVLGFKFCVVYMIYILPIFLLTVPIVILSAIMELADQPEVMGIISLVYAFGFTLLIIPYSIALSVLMPIINFRFAEKERISDGLDLAGIFRFFKLNWQNTLIVALISIGIQSLAAVGVIFVFIGIFFTIMYSYLVSAHLSGQLYLEQPGEVAQPS